MAARLDIHTSRMQFGPEHSTTRHPPMANCDPDLLKVCLFGLILQKVWKPILKPKPPTDPPGW